jgi:glycosyltransferase involved in cell wall biosynthesis
MDKIKISVIVPSYNQGEYIENCIKSIIQQDYDNWELIIQDGASTDCTNLVCEKYAALDHRIIFNSEKDKGFADAVNKALKFASGTLAVIQSSDDFFAQNCVFNDVIKIYKNDDNLSIIAGASIVVNEDLNLLATQERVEKYVPIENVYSLKDHFSQGATFFSLQRAKAINYLDSNVDMVADTDFWIRMACFEPIKINTIFQTSKIWGVVTVQPDQRSADLSKFYYGRAQMACYHVKNKKLNLSISFKQRQANHLLKDGINHYKALGKDIIEFAILFKDLNNIEYFLKKKPISFKSIIKNLMYPKLDEFRVNSKKEYFYNETNKAPFYNIKWFV